MLAATLFSTFYSYKGGVGQTLTLVNTAVELTRKGSSVIIWDMDIEAPGIQHIPYFEKLAGNIKGGFVDIAAEFIKKDCTKINDEMVKDFLITHPDNPNLCLLPAGELDDRLEYSRKFSAIQWDKLFGKGNTGGFRLFESIQQVLLSYQPDFVLIDSLSGFTDIGGICCFKLPDVVFMVLNYGDQNVKGLKGIYNALTNPGWLKRIRPERPLSTYLIASMIPMERPDLRKIRRAQWLENGSPDFTILTEIPFNGEMAFNETVWPIEYPDHQFCRYYNQIAEILLKKRVKGGRKTGK